MNKEKFIKFLNDEIEDIDTFLNENQHIHNPNSIAWRACFKHIKIIVESGEFDE